MATHPLRRSDPSDPRAGLGADEVPVPDAALRPNGALHPDLAPPPNGAPTPDGGPHPDRAPRSDDERRAMVERHLGLAYSLARRYRDSGEPLDDLVQVASLGLLKAVDRFDPSRGTSFAAFATPTILGELRRHFRDRGWAIHVPRDLKDATLRVERALARRVGSAPTPAELAAETGLDVELVLEALQARGAHRALSLDAPAGNGDDEQDEGGLALVNRLGQDDDGLARAQDRATIATLARELDAREREILRLRFVEDLTQSEIGARVGLSQMHISRLIRRALDRMRIAAQASPRHARRIGRR